MYIDIGNSETNLHVVKTLPRVRYFFQFILNYGEDDCNATGRFRQIFFSSIYSFSEGGRKFCGAGMDHLSEILNTKLYHILYFLFSGKYKKI